MSKRLPACIMCRTEEVPVDAWGWCDRCASDLDLEACQWAQDHPEDALDAPLGPIGHPLSPPAGVNPAEALRWLLTGRSKPPEAEETPF